MLGTDPYPSPPLKLCSGSTVFLRPQPFNQGMDLPSRPPPQPPSPPAPTLERIVPDEVVTPDLECAICFSQFDNVFRAPKVLACEHTFCLECLARMNIHSDRPDAIQCPLCRSLTTLPSLGLPKLTTDAAVLSSLPSAMQRVYSIHYDRNRGQLKVKQSQGPSVALPPGARRSLRVNAPAGSEEGSGGVAHVSGGWGCLRRVDPVCRPVIMATVLVFLLTLSVIIVLFVEKKR